VDRRGVEDPSSRLTAHRPTSTWSKRIRVRIQGWNLPVLNRLSPHLGRVAKEEVGLDEVPGRQVVVA